MKKYSLFISILLCSIASLWAVESNHEMHPQVKWLDSVGAEVHDLSSRISFSKTCGKCHDVDFISKHSDHANLGLQEFGDSTIELKRPWDRSTGLLGRWHLLHNQFIPDSLDSLSLQKWSDEMAPLHVGGAFSKETNCLVCHSDVVKPTEIGDCSLQSMGFDSLAFAEGKLKITIRRPNKDNCMVCHGSCTEQKGTGNPELNGLFYKTEKISQSTLNLRGKDSINRAFDIHTERGLQCSDCHFSVNHPAYYEEQEDSKPDHLLFDGRKTAIKDYLKKPDHHLAMGDNFAGQEGHDNRMDCDKCHVDTHKGQWEDRSDVHFQKLSCQACHIAKVYGPVLESVDWTKPDSLGNASKKYRNHPNDGISEGYEPLLLRRKTNDQGRYQYGFAYYPYNLVTTSLWVWGENPKPIPVADVQLAQSKIKKSPGSDFSQYQQEIAQQLSAQGFTSARIYSDVEAFPISHGVGSKKWAVRDCASCHISQNAMDKALKLKANGIKPELLSDSQIDWDGSVEKDSSGAWWYQPPVKGQDVYVFGNDNYSWLDIIGMLMVAAVIGGAFTHGSLRFIFTWIRKGRGEVLPKKTRKVYMYSVFERFWHWLQAFAVIFLLLTGLEIHLPAKISIFGFENAVHMHNIMGIILAINAAFSLFYHLASGEIKQFLPEPRGFFSQAIEQQMFYLKGIFKGDAHPFEKHRERKLNPLQKIAYLGLLNVLLPTQIFTGLLLWQSEAWQVLVNNLGGIQFIAAVHSMAAWMFAAFLIMHIYLASTGEKVSDYYKAMITGWEDVEEHAHKGDGVEKSASSKEVKNETD